VTTDSITISVAGGFTGLYGPIISDTVDGSWTVWADDVNAHGGIFGRKVVIDRVDNKFTPDGGTAACKVEQSNGSFFTVMFNAYNTEGQCLENAQIPAIMSLATNNPPTGSRAWKYVRVLVNVSQEGTTLATFVKGELQGANKKVGVVYDIGMEDQAKDGFLAKAKTLGLKVVDVEGIEASQTDLSPIDLKLQQSGAQVVALLTGADSITVLKIPRASSSARCGPAPSGRSTPTRRRPPR
jgi:ABC-type branched-subunit amino acid transport system substrate-binding protein